MFPKILRPVPSVLYKYRNLNNPFHLEGLKNNQLYFASPFEFNDPFDCVSQENIFENYSEDNLEQITRSFTNISPDKITKEKTTLLKKCLEKTQDF